MLKHFFSSSFLVHKKELILHMRNHKRLQSRGNPCTTFPEKGKQPNEWVIFNV